MSLWNEIEEFVKEKEDSLAVQMTIADLKWLLESRRLMNEKADIIKRNLSEQKSHKE